MVTLSESLIAVNACVERFGKLTHRGQPKNGQNGEPIQEDLNMSKTGVEWGGRGVEWGGRGQNWRGQNWRGQNWRGQNWR